MPKVKAKVLQTAKKDGKLLAKVQFNGKLPQKYQMLTVKWGSQRSSSQNGLYWLYLTELINTYGLKDIGFFCKEALHEAFKAKCNGGKSTTLLTKSEFGEYFMKVREVVTDFFEINDSPFWEEYHEDWAMEYGG